MIETIIKSGPLVWPLIACSVLAVAVILERAWFWLQYYRDRNAAGLHACLSLVKRGQFDKAKDSAGASQDRVIQVLATVLSHTANKQKEAMEMAFALQLKSMKRYHHLLDSIISVAPLLGILGTVWGIIISFQFLGADGIQDPKMVTVGIAQALLTTAAGLAIAIVTLLAYNFFNSRIDRFVRELEYTLSQVELYYQ